jgi:hypothetical protein
MNIVELDGKKVLVRPSQAGSTKGKDVIIGEERPRRMIKMKGPEDGQWQKNEGGRASCRDAQRPPLTSSWPNIRKARLVSGGMKTRPSGILNRTVQFL